MLFSSVVVRFSTLVNAGGVGGKLLREGRSKGRRRNWWISKRCLLWESKGEGGAVEVVDGGTGRVACWR